MLLNSINPKNFLTFGEEQPAIELNRLNLLVGANGSGKSNLIECIRLLQAAPQHLPSVETNWFWQGNTQTPSRIEAVIQNPNGPKNFRHWLEFSQTENGARLTDERVENELVDPGHGKAYFYFAFQNGWPVTNVKNGRRQLKRDEINTELSILSQRKDPNTHPEVSWLGSQYSNIKIYQPSAFEANSKARLAFTPSIQAEVLAEDYSNLGAVLYHLTQVEEVNTQILAHLGHYTGSVTEIGFEHLVDGSLSPYLVEDGYKIPFSRTSAGVLRFISLLCLLCQPNPPALVCIEGIEEGLHPQALPLLAEILVDAASQGQLIVTTHSDLLVESFLDTPDTVLTFDRVNGKTVVNRQDTHLLEKWLDEYTLGSP